MVFLRDHDAGGVARELVNGFLPDLQISTIGVSWPEMVRLQGIFINATVNATFHLESEKGSSTAFLGVGSTR